LIFQYEFPVGKTKKFIIITLAVIALAILTWRISRPAEPTYQGRKLSSWLGDYNPFSYSDPDLKRPAADAAIRHIGTNAIPTYLRILRETDSPLKLRLYWPLKLRLKRLLQKQSLIEVDYNPPAIKQHEVVLAFRQLKNRPESAIPSLIAIYDQNLSGDSKSATAEILGLYGSRAKAAIPSLLQGATNTNTYVRASAISALSRINKDPFLVMPLLLKNRRDPNQAVSDAAKYAIQYFERDTMRAIPALFESLNDPDEKIRRQATNSLKEIYPEFSAQAGFK
jgi:hypothetical protein